MNSNSLHASLQKAANILVQQIKENLDKGNYPTGNDEDRPNYTSIQDSIVIGNTQENKGSVSIEIKLGGNDAPYAGAYEFGSGERAELGDKKDYKIVAKDAPALRFLWYYPSPLGRKLRSFPNPELVSFDEIEHPGIEAQPYIRPAIKDKKNEMVQTIGKEFLASILVGTKKVEVIK